MKIKIAIRFIIFSTILLLMELTLNSTITWAQQPNQWTPQVKIPDYEAATEEPPFLIADQNHVVHAFNSQPLDLTDETAPRAVFYRQWTLEQGWTDPIDIILDPSGQASKLMDVYYDQPNGMIHLVLEIGSDAIYHTQAPLALAGNATAWSTPLFVGGSATNARPGIQIIAAIAGDENGNLVITYSGYDEGNGLYAVHSTDNGNTWTEASPFYLTYDPDLIVTSPILSAGLTGQIHAVWSTFHENGEAGPGYYAKFDPVDQTWSGPIDLDPNPSIRTPNVIEYKGQIIVSYYNSNVNGNWWRRSRDGGGIFSEPVRISPLHRGTNGIVYFVTDSSNALHLFFGERIDDNNHGLWHSTWTGSGWTNPIPVVRGPQIKDSIGGKAFDPRSARAVVSNGNLVLVSWGTDGAAGNSGAWYSYTTLNTPPLETAPLLAPTPTAAPTRIPTETPVLPTPIPSPTPLLELDQAATRPTAVSQSPSLPIMVALAPVLLLLGVIVIIRQFTQH